MALTRALKPPIEPPIDPREPLARSIVRLARSLGNAVKPVTFPLWLVVREVLTKPDPGAYWLAKFSLLLTVAGGVMLWCLCAISGWFFLVYVLTGSLAYLCLRWRQETRTTNVVLWSMWMFARALYFGLFWALYVFCAMVEIWNYQTDYWTPLDAVRGWPL